jgi:cysteine desulfurase family protein
MERRVYLDHAATSYPKPREVVSAMVRFLEEQGANPGRSGHPLSLAAAREVFAAREAVARLFGAADPTRVLFMSGATEALNLALQGYLSPGDHVITSGLEHNAVMRVLSLMKERGVTWSTMRHHADGSLDPDELGACLTPATKLLILCHGSNVSGRVLPLRELARLAHARGVAVAVDAAQTAGSVPLDVEADGIDFLAFSGHKGLLGPTGTGGLVLAAGVDHRVLRPLKVGGTGSRSEHIEQPDFLPDRFEPGTPNAVGIVGLGAGVGWLLEQGVERIHDREEQLCARMVDGLQRIEGVRLVGLAPRGERTATLSFVVDGMEVSQVGELLGEEHRVMARVGLQCAPAAHSTLGTFPRGTVRFSAGPLLSETDIDTALEGVGRIACRKR